MARNFVRFVLLVCVLGGGLVVGAAPATVWVDPAYGPEGAGGHVWQVEAFAAIQPALDAVAPGGTVQVAAGQYAEWLTIDKSLTLLGAQAGVNPNAPGADPFGANPARVIPAVESRLVPPAHDVTVPAGTLITVQSDNVTIDGFTVDGDNAAITGTPSVLLNETDVNAAVGIGSYDGHVQGLLLSHNILTNLREDAIHLQNDHGSTVAQLDGSSAILYNRMDNLPQNSWPAHPEIMPPTGGTGVWVQNAYVRIAGNTMTRVATGIDIHIVHSADGTTTPIMTDNVIQASQEGIGAHLLDDLHAKSGAQAVIARNRITITACRTSEGVVPTAGLSLMGIAFGSTVLASENQLTGGDAGVLLFELPTFTLDNIVIATTTITGARYGIWYLNYFAHAQFGAASSDQEVLLRGVTITNPTVAGLFVETAAACPKGMTLHTADGTQVQGGPVGARLSGARAHLVGTVHLTGQTGQAIACDGGAEAPQVTME